MASALTYETYSVELIDHAETHDEWLSIVRFGLPTLFNDQVFLFNLICEEALREAQRKNQEASALIFAAIVDELGLDYRHGPRLLNFKQDANSEILHRVAVLHPPPTAGTSMTGSPLC